MTQDDPTRSELNRLARELANRARYGRRIHVISDFDGTVAVPAENPLHTKCDPHALNALHELADHPKCSVTFASGRSVEDLRPRLRKGNALFVPFHLIGSDGTESQAAYQRQIVKERLPQGSDRLMDEFNRVAAGLAQDHPGLVVEQKHGGVRLSVKGMDDPNLFNRRSVINKARALFARICSDPGMPVVNGQPLFQIRQDSGDDIGIRPVGFDKAYAIRKATHINPLDTIIFLCDSLSADGNDRTAAIMFNDPRQYPNAHVLQVENPHDGPVNPAAPQAPKLVLKNPEEAAYFLRQLANYMRPFNFRPATPVGP